MFTGGWDFTAFANETLALFEAVGATGLARGLVNKAGALGTHGEPNNGLAYNPQLGFCTAAWANAFRRGRAASSAAARRTAGTAWVDVIFGSAEGSLCGGGDGSMVMCRTDRGRAARGA